MKSILFIIVMLALNTKVEGQVSFNWSPNDSIVTNLSPNTYTELKIKQIKQTSDTLRLAIEVTYNDIPATWDGMVCVHGSCLGTIPAVGGTANQTPLNTVNDTGYVRLTVNPFSGTESATLRIRVYDLDNPSDGDTATWIVQGQGLGIHDYELTKTLDLYPNPAINTVQIDSDSDFDQLQIYTMNGQLVAQENFSQVDNRRLHISNLEGGMYIINTLLEGRLVGVSKLMVDED